MHACCPLVARLLTARSPLAISATHKFFSVDFQIFSRETVSDVFQIQIFTHTLGGGTEPTNPISLSASMDILASYISRIVEKGNVTEPVKMSRTCSLFRLAMSHPLHTHFPYPRLLLPESGSQTAAASDTDFDESAPMHNANNFRGRLGYWKWKCRRRQPKQPPLSY